MSINDVCFYDKNGNIKVIPKDFYDNLQDSNINHPPHYNQYKGLEIIDLTEQLNFNKGNAVKYICRAGYKSKDTELEDLKKAKWYIQREIERLEKE